ncbi:ribosome maturation protein RimP [Novosphingobium lentum]|uniref:ribosome maturation protein RimP n=1 Tax=Novosphingobium lentum TaxID=145287 RepID=UPI00082CE721|nr:ribosome maturation protein RimP [Novosphingobium lentum]
MGDIAAITNVIEPEAKALGLDLVRIVLFGQGDERTLQIMAERPETRQLKIDDCAALSHRISDRIDELEAEGIELIEGAYRLEVSSPGIDRPLTRLSDYADWAGHEAKIQLIEPVAGENGPRKSLHGTLDGVDLGTIAFTDRKSGLLRFTLDNVESAKLLLTDKLIAATRPLDTAGAEEQDIETEYLTSEQDQ